ncbi:MAG: hypothetical protein Q7T46_05480 [Polaromonas sp.]|nr:hypothetical protein [Polaromonas sp.]
MRGLTRSEYQARKFGEELGASIRSASFIAAGALAGIGVAAKSAFDIIKSQADAIDAFNDLADATGASVENVSALDRVARQTGATFETAQSVLLKFNQALANAKPDNDAGRLLKAMNLDIAQLKYLDPAEALRQTAVAFAGFENKGNKARAMQELFGKSVKDAAPFLTDLAEQTKLVGTTSTATAQQAEVFNKQLFELEANAQDAARAIATDLIPALSKALQNFNDLRKQGSMGLIIKDAAKDVFGLGKLTGDNAADIQKFMAMRERLQKDLNSAQSDGRGAHVKTLKGEIDEVNQYLDIVRTKQRNEVLSMFNGEDYVDAISRRTAKAPAIGDYSKPVKAAKAVKDPYAEASRYVESLQKQSEQTQQLTVQEQVLRDLQMNRFGLVTSKQKEVMLAIAGEIDQAKALIEQRRLDTKAQEDQVTAQKALRDEGIRLYEEVRTPLEQFNAAQDRLNVLLEAGAIDFVTAARAGELYLKALQDAGKKISEVDQFSKKLAENIQDSLGSGLADILNGNFKNIGDGFVQMINRMVAEALAADLARKLFGGNVSGGSGGGLLGSILGSGGGSGIGDFFSSLFGFAAGGNVAPGQLVRVNEQGPEMLDYQGKQYLMNGNSNARITPNGGGGGGLSQTVNFYNNGPIDKRTQTQIAAAALQGAQRGRRNL